jgi:hypothetical protein
VSARRLPPELVDYIIGFIRDNGTLRSCSLVAQAWVRSSRQKMFKDIHISPNNFQRFLELLNSVHCTVHISARHLHIHYPRDITWVMKSVLMPNPLPTVTSLTLSTSSWSDIGSDAVADLSACLPGITDLSVRSVVADGFYLVATMTREFRFLQRLFLSGRIGMIELAPAPPPPLLSHLLVLTLKLGKRSSIEVLRWIMSVETMPLIHTINISPVTKSHFAVIGTLVKRLERSLQHLDIGFCTGRNVTPEGTFFFYDRRPLLTFSFRRLFEPWYLS